MVRYSVTDLRLAQHPLAVHDRQGQSEGRGRAVRAPDRVSGEPLELASVSASRPPPPVASRRSHEEMVFRRVSSIRARANDETSA